MTITIFERRRMTLRLLREQSGIKVAQIAQILGVSKPTVRSDLDALHEEGIVQRVHGGAVLVEELEKDNLVQSFAITSASKSALQIAQQASDLVENGDTILLDASSLTLYMTIYLRRRRNLTIVTNGLEIARQLADIANNTVILVGGIVSPKGDAVVRSIDSSGVLTGQTVRKAFVSGAGFALDVGLTERRVEDADLKRDMLSIAQQVIVLMDAAQLGQAGLFTVVKPEQIDHLLVGQDAEASVLEDLHQSSIDVTVCASVSEVDSPDSETA